MAPNFEVLYSKIPVGAKEVRWKIPTCAVQDAVHFFKSKAPGVQYIATESWGDEDETILNFTAGGNNKSIKNTDST